jgi:cytochrome bd ubiquinol oxidase subunit II
VANASSSHYALTVMTWVALIFTPVVLAYQGWTYWVFRKRLTTSDLGLQTTADRVPAPRAESAQSAQSAESADRDSGTATSVGQ